ncbi:unnamed protein product [Allacma fusca]|uniref:Protein kinase domain-containing protein n=1 Tax=Allacma fusca TaxID=39272 RepID=A0A8J2LAQ1_9HEXA|nr:unnamed protein product [Allacma fusca]
MTSPSHSVGSLKLTEPCFGIFPLGSVKNTAIANVFVAVANMIIFGAGIIVFLPNFDNEKAEAKRYIRPVFWIAYYCYWGVDIYLSLLLYAASKTLNLKKSNKWMKIQITLFLSFLVLYFSHCFWLNDFSPILAVSFAVLSMYKVYSFWVVYCFIKWVRDEPPHILDLMSKLTDADLEEFEHGTSSRRRDSSDRPQDPYDRSTFEINMNHLNERSTWKLLSKTEFSTVYQAVYHKPDCSPELVAVKTIRAELLYFKTQLCEFKIRTGIGHHENIVGLIGANTENIRNRELELIVEFCEHGNFENYLQAKKMQGLFLNQLDSTGEFHGVRPRNSNSKAVTSLPILRPVETVNTLDLVRWSIHIAKGMAYLHEKKVIHGDLATRNVLNSKDQIAKINDFGLSKECYSYRGYVHSKQNRIPWRAMAPECFSGKISFSFESDVWAYGVTLFEMFTLGDTPYSHLDFPDERFVYAIKNGSNPGRPEYVPNAVYDIMKSCWNIDPKRRPNFKVIVPQLEEFLESVLTETTTHRKPSEEDSGVETSEYVTLEMPEPSVNTRIPIFTQFKNNIQSTSPYRARQDIIMACL